MQSNHEIVVPNEDLPFKMFLFEGEKGNYFRDKHWHRSIEIFMVFEGHLKFYLNDLEQELNPGEFVLVNSNEIHAIDSPEPNKTVVIQIPLKTFSDYFTGEQYIRFTHESKKQDVQVVNLIREMFSAYREKKTGYDMRVKSGYYMLLYMLVSVYRELDVKDELLKQNRKLNKLTPITNYMKEHYQEELSLEALAEVFGYAPAYISRMFQKYAGINYKDYLQNIRLEHAVKDLENTDKQIVDIAFDHGFANSKAFTNLFRKRYGMLTSEYRKQLVKKKQRESYAHHRALLEKDKKVTL